MIATFNNVPAPLGAKDAQLARRKPHQWGCDLTPATYRVAETAIASNAPSPHGKDMRHAAAK
jgi:hypothetical protein